MSDPIENFQFPEHEVLAPTGAAEEEEASYWQWAMGRAKHAPREGNLRLPEFGKVREGLMSEQHWALDYIEGEKENHHGTVEWSIDDGILDVRVWPHEGGGAEKKYYRLVEVRPGWSEV